MKSQVHTKNRLSSTSHQFGFSLLELLIVMAIFSIVMSAVMGTLLIAQKTNTSNQYLIDTTQNVRAAAQFIHDDVITTGERYMGQVPGDSVFVKRGFLASMDFPDTDMIDPTNSYDEVLAIQGTQNTNSTKVTLGKDANGNDTTNFRVYAGSGPAVTGDGVPNYGVGTDQLLILQPDTIELKFNDDYGLQTPDPDSNPEIAVAKYTAKLQFNGSDLMLQPYTIAGFTPPTNNVDAAGLFPDPMTSKPNPSDYLLARRLLKVYDCVIVRKGSGQQFLLLVTDVDASDNIIVGFGAKDPIGINPDAKLLQDPAAGGLAAPAGRAFLGANGDVVDVTKAKLVRYYIGGPKDAATAATLGLDPDFCAMYRREGAQVDPVAFNITNFHCTFTLVEEEILDGNGSGKFYIMPGPTLANFDTDPPDPPAPAPNRTRRWNRTAVRLVKLHIFGRSPGKYRKPTVAVGNPNEYKDYLNINQDFTISLRNAAYNK